MNFKITRASAAAMLLACLIFLTSCGVDISGKPPFDDLAFSSDFSRISAPDGRTWQITFEYPVNSTFEGVVRHTSRWHDSAMPFMSHDILVTTGDFSSKSLVNVSVINHEFFYHYGGAKPNGSIHLLHAIPISEEIYNQLVQVRDWNQAGITGREIFRIDRYDSSGKSQGYWTDYGCNSILVTAVNVRAEGTPIP